MLTVLLVSFGFTPAATAASTVPLLGCVTDPVVTSTANSGAGSLRNAVADACPNSTITVNLPANSTTTLTSGSIFIPASMTIDASGSSNYQVSGNNASRVFQIATFSNVTVTLTEFTVRNGFANQGQGGGIVADALTTLILNRMIVRDNDSTYAGGGLYARETFVTIQNSSFMDNGSSGAVTNAGTLTVDGSTFDGNFGVGLGLDSGLEGNIRNSTFTNNSGTGIDANRNSIGNLTNVTIAYNVGGITQRQGAVMNLTNTLLSNNVGPECVGTIGTNLNNLVEDNSCPANAVNRRTGDALLAPLAGNGGSTQTHALLVGSPAINGGDVTACNNPSTVNSRDQRGQPRPTAITCDIGAYQTTIVTSTEDAIDATDGVCTLREAMTATNSNTTSGSVNGECAAGNANSADVIGFALSGTGVKTFTPTTPLPPLTEATSLDGITQSGAGCTPRNLLIEVNGTNAGAETTGISLASGSTGSTIRGLVINRFAGAGIALQYSGTHTILCNHIGTDSAGTAALGNGQAGILLNVATNSEIGTDMEGAYNLIVNNGSHGVAVNVASTGNSLTSNQIYANSGLGIDLGLDGVTPNDGNDSDMGANNLQNYPVLEGAYSNDSGATGTAVGMLTTNPNRDFRIEVFANASCDGSGNGAGQRLVGSGTVNSGLTGMIPFDIEMSGATGFPAITTTATDLSTGDTSEFSTCATLTLPPDPIFTLFMPLVQRATAP